VNTVPVSSRAHALKESRAHVRRCRKLLHFQTDGYPLKRYYTTSSSFGFNYTDLEFYDVVYNTWEVTLITGPVPLLPFFGDLENRTFGLPYLRLDNRQKYIDDFLIENGTLTGYLEGVDYPDAAGTFWTNVYYYQFGGGAAAATQDDIFRSNCAPMRIAAATPLFVDLSTFLYFHVFFMAVTELGNTLTEDMVFLTGTALDLVESMTITDAGPAYMTPFTDDRSEWITNRDVQPGNPYVQQPSGAYPPGLIHSPLGGPSFGNASPLWGAGGATYGLSPTDPGYPHVPAPDNKNLWRIFVRLKDTVIETNPQLRCTVHGGPGSLVVYSSYEVDVVL